MVQQNGKLSIIEEVRESLSAMLFDRFSSPLIFSYCISWSLINYEFFLILLSKTNIDHKIQLLHWYFYSHPLFLSGTILSAPCWVYNSFFFPLLSAAVYIFGYPHINILILEFVLKRKVKENEIKNGILDTTTYTMEDIRKSYINPYENEITEYKILINRLQTRETALQDQLDSIPTSNKLYPKKSTKKIPFELGQGGEDVLKALGNISLHEVVTLKAISASVPNYSQSQVNEILGQLEEFNLITRYSKTGCGLTNQGRNYIDFLMID